MHRWTDFFDPLPGEPYLEPLFVAREWTPHVVCHHDSIPLPEGSRLCCMVCHRSGRDGSRKLTITREDLDVCESKTFDDQWGCSNPTVLEPDGLRGGV